MAGAIVAKLTTAQKNTRAKQNFEDGQNPSIVLDTIWDPVT
jgi:hypothetical protein